MKRRRPDRGRLLPAFALCFAAGVATGWWLRGSPPLPRNLPPAFGFSASASDQPAASSQPVATTGEPVLSADRAPDAAGTIDGLRRRDLRMPIDGVDVERLQGMFGESRDAGGRAHEAVDILAPRNTPVHAAEDGSIAKLFYSKAGGNTVYQFDPAGTVSYYYAHLERYADGLREGQRVKRGDVIGYVGTSGNAPANTPHLHFAVFQLGPDKRWWKGRPIDPYLVFKR